MSEVLVDVQNVSKKFCRSLKRSLWYGVQDIAGDLRMSSCPEEPSLRQGEFWAVQDASFQLRRGECMGLIGANGAGKSTLLKILNGLIKPDYGSVEVRGRVGALIELGAGFHPVLTGRENIYINAAVLGLSRREVDRQLDEIIAFAEIGDAIDAPVRSYSSGMKVRLGFAVAAHLKPDILLIDEVLAVGDVGFRARCYKSIGQIMPQTAVIFVSHGMGHVKRLCNRAILVDKGQAVLYDEPGDAIDRYLQNAEASSSREGTIHEQGASLADLVVRGNSGGASIRTGEPLAIDFTLQTDTDQPQGVVVYLMVLSSEQLPIASSTNLHLPAMQAGQAEHVSFQADSLALAHGNYCLSIAVYDANQHDLLLWHQAVGHFEVKGDRNYRAGMALLGQWHTNSLRRQVA